MNLGEGHGLVRIAVLDPGEYTLEITLPDGFEPLEPLHVTVAPRSSRRVGVGLPRR